MLKTHCFHCHGEEAELAGGLDLRMRRTLVAGGDSGPAVVPGEHQESLLIEYIASGMMPPDEEQKLTEEQVTLIRQWVDAGAPTLRPEPEITPQPGTFLFTADEREHWSFRPIRKPAVPADASESTSANPIDAFVRRRLAEESLEFSPPADRLTLIRRVTFDLHGLPPTPAEIDAFLADQAPGAYERLVDRLLASPRYGERWGRHWLDVVGYADSEGYDDKDVARPDAWMYRDYVIRSFNLDKPWDQFIVEQLAGDELVKAYHSNAESLANRSKDALEKLTATGFLRMAPDGTGSGPDDPQLARQQVITDTLHIVSSSLLGMTVGCAECHDHRFDPIPQEDFYRLRAIFEPVYDPGKWRMPVARRAAILSAEERERADTLEAQAKQIDARHDARKDEVLQTILARVLEGVPAEDRDEARAAFETPAAERSPEQQELLKDRYPMLGLLHPGRLHLFLARFKDGAELSKTYEDLQAEAAALRAQKPQPRLIRVATEDPSHIPETHVFHRGDFQSPEPELVLPGGLAVLAEPSEDTRLQVATAEDSARLSNTFPANDPDLPSTGRRLAFARYLTNGQHPLVARVLVNRFWLHHFGRGLVESTADFGTRATAPTHPDLLDWLAADFMEHGWQLKRLHKLILTSRTYRQSSRRSSPGDDVDVDNRLLWRMPIRRLDAEAVRDATLAVSGRLVHQLSGPPVPVATDEAGIINVGDPDSNNADRHRRTCYVEVRRTRPVALLEAFDSPAMEPNCPLRVSSTVATQSLAMLNGRFSLEQSQAMADRLLAETARPTPDSKAPDSKAPDSQIPDLEAQQVQLAWQYAFGRRASPDDLAAMRRFLAEQTAEFRAAEVKSPERKALATLCQVLLSSNLFLYVD